MEEGYRNRSVTDARKECRCGVKGVGVSECMGRYVPTAEKEGVGAVCPCHAFEDSPCLS